MSTIIQEPTPRSGQRKLLKGLAAAVLAVGVVATSTVSANAVTYGGGAANTLTVSGPGVSGSAGNYTVDLSDNAGAGITVSGAGYNATGSTPALPPSVQAFYTLSPGSTPPSNAGIYAIVGRTAALPGNDGSSSTDSGPSVWIHNGSTGVIPSSFGAESNWTNASTGTFSEALAFNWRVDPSNSSLYQLQNERTGAWFNADGGSDNVFQVYTRAALGSTDSSFERVIDLTLVP